MHALTYVPVGMCKEAMARGWGWGWGGQEEAAPRTAEDRESSILGYSECALIACNKVSLLLTFNLHLGG